LAEFLKSHTHVNLLYVGEGPMLPLLQELALSLGVSEKVHFVGFVDNTELWMSASDVLILASKFEGFPQVAIQAAAVGLPVIATQLEEYSGCNFIQTVHSGDSMVVAVEKLVKKSYRPTIEFEKELLEWASDSISLQQADLLAKVYNEIQGRN